MRVALLVLASILLGCDDQSPKFPPDPVGVWALQSIGGNPLPYQISWTIASGSPNFRWVVADTIHINPGGDLDRYLRLAASNPPVGMIILQLEGGTWHFAGDQLTLMFFGGHDSGAPHQWAGEATLTRVRNSQGWVYARVP